MISGLILNGLLGGPLVSRGLTAPLAADYGTGPTYFTADLADDDTESGDADWARTTFEEE